jgi:cyclic pyranopterin phosphate synthase
MRLSVLEQFDDSPARPPGLDSGPRSISAVKVLRISVTDRCNYRCVYCMPADGVRWLPKEDILTFEEIVEVVRAAIEGHGIRRFKLTGGEPTVRHGIVELVRMIRSIEGVEDLSLTTNGELLADLARPLKDAGLHRVTVSLDSLRHERFHGITRTGNMNAVFSGLDACETVGLVPLKINVVTMRGSNDDEVVDFARLTLNRPLTVRFIEYMPLGDSAVLAGGNPFVEVARGDGGVAFSTRARVDDSEHGPAGGCGAQERGDVFVPESEVRAAIESQLGPLASVDRAAEPGVGPATVWKLSGAVGRIGFISAMSAPFCESCNRLRLTANGVLRSCLFEGGEVDVRGILRSPANTRQALADAMERCVRLKPIVHSNHGNMQMSRIGG